MTTRWGTRGERGATAVEYGLLMAGVALLLVFVLPAMGISLGDVVFPGICHRLAVVNQQDPATCD